MTVVDDIRAHNSQFRNRDDLARKVVRMQAHPYPFFRATAHLFYRDMAAMPSSPFSNAQTGRCWLAGDMHPANFGAMRDAGGAAVFAVSDVDEAYIGQYLWDLRRLAAGLVLANYASPLSAADRLAAVAAMATAYLGCMSVYKDGHDAGFRLSEDNTSGIVQKTIRKAARADRADLLDKFAGPETEPVDADTLAALMTAMPGYMDSVAQDWRQPAAFYEVLGMRQRFGAGMGSLGKLRYYVLLQGGAAGKVILELKQAIASAVALAAPAALPAARYGNHEGSRVALAQQVMLPSGDVLAGYATLDGMAFHAHEKAPSDKDFNYDDIASAAGLNKAAASLGVALASAHVAGGHADRTDSAGVVIAREIDSAAANRIGFIKELSSFAVDYAAKVEQDWQTFVAAAKNGAVLY